MNKIIFDLTKFFSRDGDKLYGRGSTDDKGPVLGWLHVIQVNKIQIYLYRVPNSNPIENEKQNVVNNRYSESNNICIQNPIQISLEILSSINPRGIFVFEISSEP